MCKWLTYMIICLCRSLLTPDTSSPTAPLNLPSAISRPNSSSVLTRKRIPVVLPRSLSRSPIMPLGMPASIDDAVDTPGTPTADGSTSSSPGICTKDQLIAYSRRISLSYSHPFLGKTVLLALLTKENEQHKIFEKCKIMALLQNIPFCQRIG